jgi:hypothetical protein
MALVNKNKNLDKTKTLGFYNIDYNNCNVLVTGVPDYMFGPEGVIKKMKTNGEWVYDENMINYLAI